MKPCPACGCWLNTSEYVPAEAAWNTRSDAHLLRSHDVYKAALLKIEQETIDHVAVRIARAALTGAAALEPQKDGNDK